MGRAKDFFLPVKSLEEEVPDGKTLYSNAIKIAWPSVVESVLMSMVGFVDTMMVSSLGNAAITAVGLTQQPKLVIFAFFFSLNIGSVAVVARRIGEGRREEASSCLRQALLIAILMAVVLVSLGYMMAEPFLKLAGAQADTIEASVTYFRIILVGLFFQSIAMVINGALRGAGNTKITLRTNVTANVVNIIFNYLLIEGHLGFPGWGVAGAAVATSMGNFASFVMAFYSVLSRNSKLHLQPRKSWKLQKQTVKSLWMVSSSAVIEQFCMRFGNFTFARIVANLGTDPFAAHQVAMNVMTISFTFGDGMAVAASALVGQSMGAKRFGLAEVYGKVCQRISIFLATGLVVILVALRYPIVGLFFEDPAIMEVGSRLILIIAAFSHAQMTCVIYAGALRAAGDTRFVAIVALAGISLVRPGLSWLLCYPLGFGLPGVWFGLLVDMYLRMVLNTWRYMTGKWKHIVI